MEEKNSRLLGTENIVCTVCREYGPGKLNDCHIDFMNCRVYDDLVKRLEVTRRFLEVLEAEILGGNEEADSKINKSILEDEQLLNKGELNGRK